eukprot:gene7895-5520_t
MSNYEKSERERGTLYDIGKMEEEEEEGRGNRRFSNFDKTSSSSAAFGTLVWRTTV